MRQASASALAAVPVNTGNTITSRSNKSLKRAVEPLGDGIIAIGKRGAVIDRLKRSPDFGQRAIGIVGSEIHVVHQFPVLAMDAQGSRGGSGWPSCSSSIEMPSGERIKAMWPSRGGRLMVTPAAISRSQSA